jgi:hypothetical protein
MLDPHIDRRIDRLQRRPFAAADTCPEAAVLAGSTCPVVADHIGQVVVDRTGLGVGRNPGLAAGTGWASRSCWAAVGCSSLVDLRVVDLRRRPVGAAGGAGMKVGRPGRMSVIVRCQARRDGTRCGAATC